MNESCLHEHTFYDFPHYRVAAIATGVIPSGQGICAGAILAFDFNSHNLLLFLNWCAYCHGSKSEDLLQMNLESGGSQVGALEGKDREGRRRSLDERAHQVRFIGIATISAVLFGGLFLITQGLA
jgi:hypothetical protein